ncbi:MAG: HD domain-containing protein [Chitinophagaceae bacterium]
MRLMNFDVPYIQDLASTRRFPHSIGTCFLAFKTVEKTALPLQKKKKLIAAALLHDIGILPYGHLLESIIKTKDAEFSHEKLVYSILTGNYHPLNRYHQILRSVTIRLHKILNENDIKPQELFDIICPQKGTKSAISADVDLDNLDNVHRMAALLGYEKAKSNLNNISNKITIDNNLNLVFEEEALENIEEWLRMRQSIYTMIIGHPECVPYNAFLSKLLTESVDLEIVKQNEWYITDADFEAKLIDDPRTSELASSLLTRPKYELVDYIWFISNERPQIELRELERLIQKQNFETPKKTSFYFFWTENKLISREVMVNLPNQMSKTIGRNSHSILVSLVTKSDLSLRIPKFPENSKSIWRKEVHNYVQGLLPGWKFSVKFPSDYSDKFFNSKITYEQLRLFAQ